METRIIALETSLAYQERLIQDLNGVIASQQKQIDALRTDIDRILSHLKAADAVQIARPDEDTPPPHY